MFADSAKIYIRSGKGGDGHVSFRRELYVPNGGPDGGDGGHGGSVILEVDDGLNTLADYRHVRKYHAEDGENGNKKKCRGKDGSDIILKMPEGTVVKEDRSLMNVPFVTGDKELDAKFVEEATKAGFVNLKGHRTVGGMRASIYNAMPKEGVEKLVAFMKKFEEENA